MCLRVEGDRIADAGLESLGCALCRASASFMTCSLKGCTVQEARRLNAAFQQMVSGGEIGPEHVPALREWLAWSRIIRGYRFAHSSVI